MQTDEGTTKYSMSSSLCHLSYFQCLFPPITSADFDQFAYLIGQLAYLYNRINTEYLSIG
jgi:hypothetical protein